MYLYYLLGWKLTTKYFGKWEEGGNETELKREFEVRGEKSSILCMQTQAEYFLYDEPEQTVFCSSRKKSTTPTCWL